MKYLILTRFFIIFILYFTYNTRELESAERTQKTYDLGCEVFIDVSNSMRWYFKTKKDGQPSTIQKFLQIKFAKILNDSKLLNPVYFSEFNDVVPTPELIQNNIDMGEKFLFKSYKEQKEFFSGKGTDLVGVFKNEKFGTHLMSIIITDNIHSFKNGLNSSHMRDALNEFAKKGLHIYLIGIKSYFKGLISPILTGQTTRIWYSGLRPIYIWIVTPSIKLGDSVTKEIMTWLRKHMQSELVNEVNNRNQSEIEKSISNTEGGGNLNFVSLTDINLMNINEDFLIDNIIKSSDYIITAEGEFAEVVLSRYLKDEAKISIRKTNFDDYLSSNWKVIMTIEPEVRWANIRENKGVWTISIKCKKIPRRAVLKLNVLAVAVADNSELWWEKWSTEDDSTVENGGKTLGLNYILQDFTNPFYSKSHKLNSFDLKIIQK
ncbi:MAG: hypothetical protein ACUZ8I_14575 [Candidatus Scalindua sp.]